MYESEKDLLEKEGIDIDELLSKQFEKENENSGEGIDIDPDNEDGDIDNIDGYDS